jgi:hypothetical protein
MVPGRGAQIGPLGRHRIELIAVEHGNAQLKMPSGEIRLVNAKLPRDHRRRRQRRPGKPVPRQGRPPAGSGAARTCAAWP